MSWSRPQSGSASEVPAELSPEQLWEIRQNLKLAPEERVRRGDFRMRQSLAMKSYRKRVRAKIAIVAPVAPHLLPYFDVYGTLRVAARTGRQRFS